MSNQPPPASPEFTHCRSCGKALEGESDGGFCDGCIKGVCLGCGSTGDMLIDKLCNRCLDEVTGMQPLLFSSVHVEAKIQRLRERLVIENANYRQDLQDARRAREVAEKYAEAVERGNRILVKQIEEISQVLKVLKSCNSCEYEFEEGDCCLECKQQEGFEKWKPKQRYFDKEEK